jgi:uncharacterized protein YrrD
MRRLSEADGEPILSRESAERIGKVRHVVIDVAERRIAALHVDGRRKKARLVDWSAITGFGPDSIIIDSERSLRSPDEGEELEVASGHRDLHGRLVLSDEGLELGRITDIVFDEESGALITIVTDREEHPAGRLRALGPYCMILAAGDLPALPAHAGATEGASAHESPY